MFDPKDINPKITKEQLQKLGIDMATLERAAKVLMEIPELKSVFEKQTLKESSERNINKVYKEVEDIFDHNEDAPDDNKK